MNKQAFIIGYLAKQAAIKPASPPAYNGAQDPNPEPLDPRQNRFSKVLTAISASKQAPPPGEGEEKQADCGESHIEPRPKLEPLLIPDLKLGDDEDTAELADKEANIVAPHSRDPRGDMNAFSGKVIGGIGKLLANRQKQQQPRTQDTQRYKDLVNQFKDAPVGSDSWNMNRKFMLGPNATPQTKIVAAHGPEYYEALKRHYQL